MVNVLRFLIIGIEFETETTANVIPFNPSVVNSSPDQFPSFIKPIDLSAPQIDVAQPVPTLTEAGTTIVNAGNVPMAIPDFPSEISTAITDGVSTPTPQVEVAQPAPGISSNQGMELI